MSFIGDFIGDTIGGITGAKQAGEAAEKAGELGYAAAMQGIEEQRRQFDKLVELMAPYVAPGASSIQAQQELIGLKGGAAQQAAISALEQSPLFQSLARQGETAMLQQASATGGLRGGNIQAALAQFRPQMLSQAIQQQYQNLGGLSQLGQAAAAGQATQGMQLGQSVASGLASGAELRGAGVMAAGNIPRQTFGDMLNIGGTVIGAKKAGFF